MPRLLHNGQFLPKNKLRRVFRLWSFKRFQLVYVIQMMSNLGILKKEGTELSMKYNLQIMLQTGISESENILIWALKELAVSI